MRKQFLFAACTLFAASALVMTSCQQTEEPIANDPTDQAGPMTRAATLGNFYRVVYVEVNDVNPLTKGHTLVVPKMEVDYIFDLDDKTLAGMMLFAKKVAAKIKQEIACKRVAVVALGLEVPHAHIHLIPIQSENDVDFHREKLKLTPEEFREIAAKLFG